MTLIDALTRLDGRISRKPFWIGILVLVAASIAAVVAILAIMGEDALDGPYSGNSALMLVISPITLIVTVPVILKRLHDLNRSFGLLVPAFIFEGLGWIGAVTGLTGGTDINALGSALLIVHGVYALALLIYLGFYRGTRGHNDFGPDPLRAEEIPATVNL